LNPNSGLWSKRNKIEIEKNIKVRHIIKKDKILQKEINTNLKINISNIKNENNYLQNFTNNNGKTNYDGNLRNISKYKFSAIEKFDEYEPEIVLDKKNIIFFNKKGSILKFNEKSKLLWKKNYYSKSEKKLRPILFFSSNEKYLIVADTLAKYYLLNIETGNIIWSKYSNAPFNSQIKIFKDKFYIVDANNVLRCFLIKDGSELWNFKTETSFIKSQKKISLVIKNNKVIFNNTIGDISAVNTENGELIWQTPTQSKNIYDESMFFKTSDLIIADNSLLFSNNKNGFFSIDTESGILNWKQKINSNLRPTFIDDLIFTITNEGFFVVLENKTGNLIRSTYIFKNLKKKKRKKIKPVGFLVGKKNIYLTTTNGRLYVIDILTGTVQSILRIDKEKISRPIVQLQNLYITKNNSIIKLN
jgi:outer membrane protein assembly factor BamB